MLDIRLDEDGDLYLTEDGDIAAAESVRQAIRVRLRWIQGEWRLGYELGFPWFEQVFVKNPNTAKIRQLLRAEILSVEEVTAASVDSVDYDRKNRTASFTYTATVDEATFTDEVTLYG